MMVGGGQPAVRLIQTVTSLPGWAQRHDVISRAAQLQFPALVSQSPFATWSSCEGLAAWRGCKWPHAF